MWSSADRPNEIDVQDVEYVRHGSTPLLASFFRPRGPGPFPVVVEIHGGAWNSRDRLSKCTIKEEIAKRGVGVLAIDFRMPPTDPYPAAVVDVNFAIRWVKANASELHTTPELVGVMGSSSGGHLAVLAAMRPHDSRYSIIPNPPSAPNVDATVRCVIGLWPVISPLGRYRYARQMVAEGEHLELADSTIPGHEQFWQSEAAMAEGDPVLILERREPTEIPPVLCIQSPTDPHHPIGHLERFAALYREAGGQVALELPGLQETPHVSVTLDDEPNMPSSVRLLDQIAEFVGKNVA